MKKQGAALSPRSGRILVTAAVVEGVIKVIALVDLASRPATQVRGRKAVWATSITLVNPAGVVPLAYLMRGRRD